MLKITIPEQELALAESLYASLQEANRLDGWHAMEHDGSYGAIKSALITTLAYGFIGADKDAIGQAERQFGRRVADVIYMTALESGITLTEAIPVVEPMWCYDCARFVKRQDCLHMDENWCGPCQEIHDGYCDARVKEHLRHVREKGDKEVMNSGRCVHGFSIHSRCPLGCDEELEANEMMVAEDEHPYETGWTGR